MVQIKKISTENAARTITANRYIQFNETNKIKHEN